MIFMGQSNLFWGRYSKGAGTAIFNGHGAMLPPLWKNKKLIILSSKVTLVGWVIWPAKTVPEMTYNVFSGTLNPTHSLTSRGCLN